MLVCLGHILLIFCYVVLGLLMDHSCLFHIFNETCAFVFNVACMVTFSFEFGDGSLLVFLGLGQSFVE